MVESPGLNTGWFFDINLLQFRKEYTWSKITFYNIFPKLYVGVNEIGL